MLSVEGGKAKINQLKVKRGIYLQPTHQANNAKSTYISLWLSAKLFGF